MKAEMIRLEDAFKEVSIENTLLRKKTGLRLTGVLCGTRLHAEVEDAHYLSEDRFLVDLYIEIDVDIDVDIYVHDWFEEASWPWSGPGSWTPTSHERSYSDTISRTLGVSLEGFYSKSTDAIEDLSVSFLGPDVRISR